METLGPSVNRFRSTLDEYRHMGTLERNGVSAVVMRQQQRHDRRAVALTSIVLQSSTWRTRSGDSTHCIWGVRSDRVCRLRVGDLGSGVGKIEGYDVRGIAQQDE